MMQSHISTIINAQNGNLALKIFAFEDNHSFDHLQRHNYFSIIVIEQGTCTLKADFSEYAVEAPAVMFFAPYQPFMLGSTAPIRGWAIHFHSDFFCIHKHHRDVACNGTLFNIVYEPPFLPLTEAETATFSEQTRQMLDEMQSSEAAQHNLLQHDLLVAYLKILLIHAVRIKARQREEMPALPDDSTEPVTLTRLKEAVEEHFRTKHSAAEYAEFLNVPAKSLAKMTKRHLNKTLTDVIVERIVIEAKRELYLTSKSVKEIAYELGFHDEHYFSRFFKTNADVSPQVYRDTVGFARAEA